MRKCLLIAIIMSVCLAFAGCGKSEEGRDSSRGTVENNKGGESQGDAQVSQDTSAGQGNADGSAGTDGKADGGGAAGGKADTEGSAKGEGNTKAGRIRLLGNRSMSFVSDMGYYYITDEPRELKKDLWGRHIMYMDFATRKEVYLCNEPGCKHRDENCTSVLTDDFSSYFLIFVAGDKLYLVNRDNDNEEGTMSSEIQWDGKNATVPEKMPTVLYSMGLDGTNRKKEYTFEQDVTVDDAVLWDGEALYFAAKKISTSTKKEKVAAQHVKSREKPAATRRLLVGDTLRRHFVREVSVKVVHALLIESERVDVARSKSVLYSLVRCGGGVRISKTLKVALRQSAGAILSRNRQTDSCTNGSRQYTMFLHYEM